MSLQNRDEIVRRVVELKNRECNAQLESANIQFKIAAIDDAPDLTELINESFNDAVWFRRPPGQRTSLKDVQKSILETFSNEVLIMLEKRHNIGEPWQTWLLGCVQVSFGGLPDVLEYFALSVNARFRRLGYSKMLILFSENLALQLCCKKIQLYVVSVQDHLKSYYENLGYECEAEIDFELGYEVFRLPAHLLRYVKYC